MKQSNKYIMVSIVNGSAVRIENTPIIVASNKPEAWGITKTIADKLGIVRYGISRVKTNITTS